MEYQDKVAMVETLAGKFSQAPIAILADYRGLTVSEITEVRNRVREADGELVVAKNTLTRLAIRDTDAAAIEPLLQGPTALAFGADDAAALAKALDGFAKDNEAFEIKGGVMEGELLDTAQIKQLASLPGRDELRAKLLALLTTPATQLVRVLQAPAQQLAQVMQARAKQQENG